jgi:hypothetical protein
MKKITIAILILLGTFSMASAELGINVGISGNTSVFQATGEESTADSAGASTTDVNSEDATAVVGYTSFFLEKTLGFLPGPLGNLSLGYDYVSETMTSDQVENNRLDNNVGGAATVVENTVKVAFEDLTTIYLTANITDNLYAKYGWVDVDVITKESLATGSDYGNSSLSGTTYGLGYNKTFGSNFFIRGEAMYMDMGGLTLTSTTNSENTVKVKDMTGATARFSVGKSF